MKFNAFKRKIIYLIDRIRLSETAYENMKLKAHKYDAMMSAITAEYSTEYTKAISLHESTAGATIIKIPKSKLTTLTIDIEKLLESAGIYYNKYSVEINVN